MGRAGDGDRSMMPFNAMRLRAAGGGGIDPTTLFAGTDGFYFDFTDASTLFADGARTTPATLNGNVVGVTDLSGNNRHINDTATGSGPIRRSGFLEFNGGTQLLVSTGWTIGSPEGWTIVVAHNNDSVAGAFTLTGGHYSSSGLFQGPLTNDDTYYSLIFDNAGNFYVYTSGPVVSVGTPYVLSNVVSPTLHAMWQNGVSIQSQSQSLVLGGKPSGRIAVGADWLGTTTANQRVYDGKLYAAFFINRPLTTVEREGVETWMRNLI